MNDTASPASALARPSVCKNAHITDALLETAITAAHTRVVTAPTVEECRAACEELCDLVAQRSRDQIRFMERMKGLK